MTKLYIPRNSQSEDHRTPDKIYQPLHKRFKFTRDLAASKENTKCKNFYSKEDNALTKNWRGSCWCNPPYDTKTLTAFVEKAIEQRKNYRQCVMLLPCKCDQPWWHMLWEHYEFIQKDWNQWLFLEWVKGRISFEGPGCTTSAFLPGVVMIIKGERF